MFAGARTPTLWSAYRLVPPTTTTREEARFAYPRLFETIRTLHAVGQPVAFDLCQERGRRGIYLTVDREIGASNLAIFDRFYRQWRKEEVRLAPSYSALQARDVGALVPSGPHRTGPFLPLSELEWGAPWRGLFSLGLRSNINLWLRVVLTPLGTSRSRPLPIDRTEGARPPEHRIGKKVLDSRMERHLDQIWTVGGVVSIWGANDRATAPRAVEETRQLVQRTVEALSAAPGGCGFSVHWPRWRRSQRQLLEHDFGGHLGLRRKPLLLSKGWLSTGEVASWFPPLFLPTSGLRSPVPVVSSLCIGTDAVGTPVEMYWHPQEGHHLLTAGETGMGKSTLLVSAALSTPDPDVAIVVIDPRGDTVRSFITHLDERRLSRTTYIAPTQSPVAQNVLSMEPPPSPSLAGVWRERHVSELVSAFRRVRAERYGETFYWGPRIEEVLTQVLLFLSQIPRSTLTDALTVLEHPETAPDRARQEAPGNPELAQLADRISSETRENLEGARRVVSEVVLFPSLATLLSARDAHWDFSLALGPGKMTLISLEQNVMSTRGASYLGSIFLSLLWSRILSRGPSRNKVLVILDEVQDYANASLAEMLRQGRNYGVHVWCATQSISALPLELKEALLTNARDLILFRGSPNDSRLAQESFGLPPEDNLMALPRGNAYAFLGKSTTVARVQIRSPTAPSRSSGVEGRLLELQEASRKFWSVSEHNSGQPQPGTPGLSAPNVGTEGEVQRIIDALMVGMQSSSGDGDFSVPLSVLRRMANSQESLLRRVGRTLSGRGVLIRVLRQKPEHSWILSRSALLNTLPGPMTLESRTRAGNLWSSAQEHSTGRDPDGA